MVCENFFNGKGGKTDSGEELVCLSLDEIESSKIKPDFLKENIKSIIGAKEETMVDRGSSFIDALIFVLKDIRIDGWN